MSAAGRVHGFFQRWRTLRGGSEVSRVDGGAEQRREIGDAGLVVETPGVAAEIRTAIGAVLRLLATVLVVSPFLLVAKLLSPRWLSDTMTVGFVIAVVAFFTTLCLYFVASFAWWLRRHHARLRFREPAADRTDAVVVSHPSEAAEGTRVRARGRVLAFDGAAPVVVRVAAGQDGSPWRIVEACDFAVMPADSLPIIARIAIAPVVIGATTQVGPDEIAGRFRADTVALGDARDAGDYVEIAAGDEVEITGVVDRIVPDSDQFVIDGVTLALPRLENHDPYRRPSGPAIVIGGDASPQIVITIRTDRA